MTSQSKETRQKQKAEWEETLRRRLAFLGEKGGDAEKIARDVRVKELRAKIRESQFRLQAIDAIEKRTAGIASVTPERSAKPKKEAPKQKDAAAPASEAKPKKNTKKEESAEPQQA